ncbi:MAG: Na+/H+ antiporter subunit E [Angelakisella sp.]
MILLLFVVWIVLNSTVTWEIVWVGVLVSAAVDLFSVRVLGFPSPRLRTLVAIAPLCLLYLGVLLREVLKSNLHIIKLVLAPRIAVQPMLITFCPGLNSNAARVALANSITLTPGTITVAVEGDEFVIHALDYAAAEGIEDSVFIHLLQRMEARAAACNKKHPRKGGVS